jgi:hypothetical protein
VTYRAPKTGRRPLVYASPRALEQAAVVLPGRVLENEVGRAILEQRAKFVHSEDLCLVSGRGWLAKCLRVPSPLTDGRRCWRVVEVRAL